MADIDLSRYSLGWSDAEDYVYKARRGLDERVVRDISAMKGEPDWMLAFRLKSLRAFERRPMPHWGGDMSGIHFDDIFYYIKPTEGQVEDWEDLPEAIRATYERLGIPEAERRYLAGVTTQYESEVVFHRNREDLERRGVVFCDMDTALREYPEIVKRYFGTVIPRNDNKFAALNSAVWSGGSFIYVPPGVEVEMPLQAYFRINAENMGQFERTLIIADEGSKVHYLEGCLLEGERIDLPGGQWRAVEDIAPGDTVVGHDGRPAHVVDVMKRDYRGATYRIIPQGSANAFIVTGEHPILAVARARVGGRARNGWLPEVPSAALLDTDPEWVPARDLQVGDFLVYPKVARDGGVEELHPSLVRLAGYFLAEGHAGLANGCKALMFSFHEDETEYVEEVRDLCEDLWGTRGSVRKDRRAKAVTITVYTEQGFDLMREHVGHGAGNKRLSPTMFGQPDDSVVALIDAYVRGEGNRTNRRDSTWFCCHTVSYDWALQLQSLLARLDIFATVRCDRKGGPGVILGREVNRQDLYLVQWTTGGVGRSLRVRDAGDYFLVPVTGIEEGFHDGPVFNFETAGVHSYNVRGFATHNCSAPVYSSDSLHSAVVEIVVRPSARVTYTTIQNWSSNVFNLVTKRARVEAEGHMEWIDGNMGCIAQGSEVLTPQGPRPIEQVRPGDPVASLDEHSGQLVWRTVTAFRRSGIQPVLEVRQGNRSLRATANHPFYSYTHDRGRPSKLGRHGLGWVRADEVHHAIMPTCTPDYGEPRKLELPGTVSRFHGGNQWGGGWESVRVRPSRLNGEVVELDEDLAWLFGLYLGDGSMDLSYTASGALRSAKVQFSVPITDRAHPRLRSVMGHLAPSVGESIRRDAVVVSWSSVELAELFLAQGLGGTAATGRVPDWVADQPEDLRLSFLAGLIDSDGHVADGGRNLVITSVSRELIDEVARVLTTLGIPSRTHAHSPGGDKEVLGWMCRTRPSWRIAFPADARFVGFVSAPVGAAIEGAAERTCRPFRRVGRSGIELPASLENRSVSVNPVGLSLPTYDIEVDGTGNFWCNGFIVHNSRLTMKYPGVVMVGPKASGEVLSVAYAGAGQHQDTGAKMVHAAPETTSRIVSKSISKDGGRTSYRGLVRVEDDAHGCVSHVQCDALILDEDSVSDTYPYTEVGARDAVIGHEATVSKVADEQLFYLMSRGLSQDQATSLVVNGFIEPVTRTLPMEYAVEWSRLIELQIEDSVG